MGGITGTSISGTVSYNPATQTFTLNNAVITPARITGGGIRHAITSESDLKVVLVGHNVLGTAPQDPSDSSNYTISSGIYAPGKDLTVTGAGSLTIYNHTSGIEGKNVTIDITGTLRVQEYGTGVMACC